MSPSAKARLARALGATRRWALRVAIATLALVTVTALVTWIAVRFWDYPVEGLEPGGGPLTITDRHGEILRKVPPVDGSPGRESWVALEDIPPLLVSAFVVAEDASFFDHGGVDWRGIVRAAALNVRERRLGYGGSTITMQLVRMIESPGKERTFRRKASEAIKAMRLERALGKRAILEQYLNRAYFGNGAIGVGAAARVYFDKPVSALSAGEATLLAVLPRAPSAYDPITHPGAALARREHVFGLLARANIMSDADIDEARATTTSPVRHAAPWRARHFTEHVLAEITPSRRAAGGTLRTSLDLALQEELEAATREHVAEHSKANLDHAGVVVLDTQSGEILAMVGSAGWDTEHGQVNIVTRRRHPGSALKPFIYALAIEGGDHPASIAYDAADVPSDYDIVHVTQKERGPVRYREALAGSYNLAAIHTLERVGVPTLMNTLRRAGVGSLQGDPQTYGLRLALGSAKVRLLDLASAYGFLARAGRVVPSRVLPGRSTSPGTQLVSPATAWLTMDMLSDPEARRPAFGHELPLDLPFAVAAKTGTSRGFADTVTIAVTEQVTVAAWGGNFDGEPTQGLIAMDASAPLARAALLAAARRAALTLPPRPEDIATADVCPLSGKRRGPHCTHARLEVFDRDHVPTESCDWHQSDGTIRYPAALDGWARRARNAGGRHLSAR